MRNIYFLGQNKSIVLYTFRNQIYRATLDGGQMIRPILLTGDYFGELSDVYYRGTVYFSYISRQHEILVKNVTDRIPEYRISGSEDRICSYPQLLEWKGHLVLLYFVQNTGNAGVFLEGVFPFEERSFRLPDEYTTGARYAWHLSGDRLVLSVTGGGMPRCYMSDEKGEFFELLEKQEVEKNSYANEQVKGEKLQVLEEQLNEKEAVIESVKVQYEDLMNTAIQYREEAKKWREKYLTKK